MTDTKELTTELQGDLVFIERMAVHHGTKGFMTPQQALSCIQHYPAISAITKSYADGKVPETRNPYAEIESLTQQLAERDAEVERLKDLLSIVDGSVLQAAQRCMDRVKKLCDERDALQAKLDAIEKQEPVAVMVKGRLLSYKDNTVPEDCELYLAPTAQQAQPERAPSTKGSDQVWFAQSYKQGGQHD